MIFLLFPLMKNAQFTEYTVEYYFYITLLHNTIIMEGEEECTHKAGGLIGYLLLSDSRGY